MLKAFFAVLLVTMPAAMPAGMPSENDLFRVNGGKPVLDAHNCYPYDGKWANRIDRALSTGYPVAIEQDIAPYVDPRTGEVVAKVTHNDKATAADPTLQAHFFDRVQPLIERALRENKRDTWPLIVLHFDFKDNSTPTLEAVWKLLGQYQSWITTGTKTADDSDLSRLTWGPLLVLTEENDNQEKVFYTGLPVGATMRLFGSEHTNTALFAGMTNEQKEHAQATLSPAQLLPSQATNYRRWWNNSWHVVEEGGQTKAGAWTPQDDARLKALVDHAHQLGYWIRFYTLDGFTAKESQGWDKSYNFGSHAALEKRWGAALAAGVNMIATDQYEALRAYMRRHGYSPAAGE